MKEITITIPAIYNNKKVDAEITLAVNSNGVVLDSLSELLHIPEDMFMRAVEEGLFKFTFPIKKKEKNGRIRE